MNKNTWSGSKFQLLLLNYCTSVISFTSLSPLAKPKPQQNKTINPIPKFNRPSACQDLHGTDFDFIEFLTTQRDQLKIIMKSVLVKKFFQFFRQKVKIFLNDKISENRELLYGASALAEIIILKNAIQLKFLRTCFLQR